MWGLFLSVMAIVWWASVWGLFEGMLEMVTGHRKNLQQLFYALFLVLIFFTFYEYPEILDQF